jgi:transcriptional regulator with XRE-family HTH domain
VIGMVVRRAPAALGEVSALRRARLARNWTLEDLAEEMDLRTAGGHAGVTPSMISGWELGRRVTSIGYRKVLCETYGQPPEILFAHQDEGLRAASAAPRLLAGYADLREAMLVTVTQARECLVVLGSRSRDAGYLAAIEEVLTERPALVHYRVLFGPPHHRVLRDHLLRLLELRDPGDRSLGVKTLHLGIVEDTVDTPERFFCASELMAAVPIPSLTSAEDFDSGVLLGPAAARRLLDHGRQAYAAARRVETPALVTELGVVKDRGEAR